MPVTLPDLQNLTINQLARIIHTDWKKPYFGAVPYINAMYQLTSVQDMYGLDSGTDIVVRFLTNAGSWRGEVAKAVKAELRKRVGG